MIEPAAPVEAPPSALRVCVAIPTYRRPALLQRLLEALARQPVSCEYAVAVLVVDNDTAPSARGAVEASAAGYPFPLSYAHCPAPGLSSVRNFAVARARGAYDLLAMIDDDECPEPQWLAELLRVADATRADAVIGPVPQRLAVQAPRWLRAGNFFALPSYPDGARIDFGYSGNCLLRLASLERFGIVFDRRLDLAGGEDLLFFRGLLARGASIAYAANAIAVEDVDAARARASYVIRLNFRRGNTLAICDRRLSTNRAVLGARALKAAGRVLLGALSLAPRFALRGRSGALRAVCDAAQGLGQIAGLFGYVYQAYRRVDVVRG